MRDILTSQKMAVALNNADYNDPFSVLGMHRMGDGLIVRTMMPGAHGITLIEVETGKALVQMENVEGTALFHVFLPGRKEHFAYRFRVNWGTHELDMEDAYRFWQILGDMDIWLLSEGTHHRPYERLGAHPVCIDGVDGVIFAVWAPNARRVSVVGNFNDWDGRRHMMRFRSDGGVWEIFIPHVCVGDVYKFEIRAQNGAVFLKADPFAFRAQLRPDTASIVSAMPEMYLMQPERQQANALNAPISIYEVHLGSWKKADGWRWLSYRELADQLIPYVKDLAFTHIELMPVMEYPFDESWGYQPTGLYAPTARYGTPEDFRYFVQTAHAHGIGVILDWVPAHFPADDHGMRQFDGTSLYEHADPKEGIHRDWGSLIYNYGRREVSNFLVGNALYWVERFGIDGLRVDAVASMLYRDYSREPGEWVPNQYGGRENLEAIAFLRRMNQVVGTERPGAMTMAEESTSFPGVTLPVWDDGLGFHFKWNLGWMNDTLAYMHEDPIYRKYHHDKIRFGMMYAFSENFVLPLSHDEVVHCKGSLIGKMPGDEWQRFANLRAYYGFMWGFPGKKLLFMGGELAQYGEWNSGGSLDWDLLQYPIHAGVQRLIRDLNRVYQDFAPLHRVDYESAGFQWIVHDDVDNGVFAFLRRDEQQNFVMVLSSFTPIPRGWYRLGVPEPGIYHEIINTDAQIYGGSGVHNGELEAQAIPAHGLPWSLELTVPPLSTSMWIKKE